MMLSRDESGVVTYRASASMLSGSVRSVVFRESEGVDLSNFLRSTSRMDSEVLLPAIC